jgi:hypothetical protein
MRVAVAGDWHGHTWWAIKLIQAARADGVTQILQLGDFGVWPGPTGKRYLDRLQKTCEEEGVEVWFVDGNHEDFVQLLAKPKDELGRGIVRPNLLHLPRGHRWKWGDRSWLALGGAASIDKAVRTEGKDWWPEEELTRAQADAAIASGPADVMVCHDYPAKVVHSFGPRPKSWALEDVARSERHSQLIQEVVDAVRPGYFLHGHLHRLYQRQTDMGWGSVEVTGLDCDGTPGNWVYLDVETMAWTRP